MAKQEVVYAELERIRRKRKALTARAVWEESVSKRSVLHDRFTWDDTEAARLHRDEEARCVIQDVTITDGERAGGRRYYHVVIADDSRYEPVEIVVANTDMYLFALHECELALIAAKKRILNLTNGSVVVKKIDAAVRGVHRMQREHQPEA